MGAASGRMNRVVGMSEYRGGLAEGGFWSTVPVSGRGDWATDGQGFVAVRGWDDLARQAEQPSLLILADGPWLVQDSGSVTTIAEALGFRILDQVSLGVATDRLSRLVDVDAVLVRCTGKEPALDLLLARLDTMAGNQGMDLVIAVDLDGLDHVHAIVGADRAVILCRPDYADVVETLAGLAGLAGRAQERERLHDISRGDNPDRRLDQMSEELGRLSRTIEALVQNRTPSLLMPPEDGQALSVRAPKRSYAALSIVEGTADQGAISARQVRAVLRARRLRESMFPANLFADPAWDILLDLMAARLENAQVSVSSLCIAAAVPPTTALRWIRQLTERGLLERQADPDDGRRIFIALSEHGAALIVRWFRESQELLAQASGQ